MVSKQFENWIYLSSLLYIPPPPPSPILPEHSSSSLFFATGINETWAETGFRAIKHAHTTQAYASSQPIEAKGSRVPALFGIMPDLLEETGDMF